jgi:hypothetical protein
VIERSRWRRIREWSHLIVNDDDYQLQMTSGFVQAGSTAIAVNDAISADRARRGGLIPPKTPHSRPHLRDTREDARDPPRISP